MIGLPFSPVPGFEDRCERRRAAQSHVETLLTEGLRGEGLVAQVRHDLGEHGVAVLRGMLATGLVPTRPAPLALFHELEGDEKTRRAFARMALDDLFRSARDLQDVVPLLGFLGRARDNVYNAMVVYVQNPRAREWRTRDEWQRVGRVVREGAQPLLTLFPFGPFRIKYDVADTNGPERNDGPGLLDAEGLVTEAHWSAVRQRLDADGLSLREVQPMESRASGFVRRSVDGFEIAIEMRTSLASQFGTLCHELAHIFLGHLGADPRAVAEEGRRRPAPRWPPRAGLPRAIEELEAEGVAFVLCCRLGLVTPAPEYITAYLAEVPEDAAPGVEMMVRAASTISRLVLA